MTGPVSGGWPFRSSLPELRWAAKKISTSTPTTTPTTTPLTSVIPTAAGASFNNTGDDVLDATACLPTIRAGTAFRRRTGQQIRIRRIRSTDEVSTSARRRKNVRQTARRRLDRQVCRQLKKTIDWKINQNLVTFPKYLASSNFKII
jgi:hypothetical protein